MRRKSNYWDDYYEPSVPKPVKDGIKAESKRGQIGSKWWSKKWISVLESFGWDNRLQRGRAYARKGQVLDIHIEPGLVTAKVQGSRSTPYKVSIKLPVLSDDSWECALKTMSEHAAFMAKLLNGEMPDEIEEAFTGKIQLFPKSSREIDADCSCPDWANPCKHIAAVYYLLAEEFDRDPFMLFLLRGRTKEQVLSTLVKAHAPEELTEAVETSGEHVEPLDASSFFAARNAEKHLLPPIETPVVEASILRRLGSLPLSQPVQMHASLRELYREVSEWAIEKAAGEDCQNKT
ncbi:MAG: SWIM zinc finger family protein [Armatimonadota bacterium]